ncbi:hypothetical protein [Cellulomonas sp. ATA003]|uniref:hypothetical protein n=1 Tax=Cellulomonas sp. ATA003 TaxID=3073064 RepID=UPI00287370D1|nr:hypothetical protein [Cellulomonas sp. ATA003]WNB86219.1 hypothetical protein REH70_02825 [Cellulomonas sp. ATA003]
MANGTVVDVQRTGEVEGSGGRRPDAEATWGTVPASVCQGECGTHGPPAPQADPLAQLGDRLDTVIALLRDLAAASTTAQDDDPRDGRPSAR